jgi:hypothetical protein
MTTGLTRAEVSVQLLEKIAQAIRSIRYGAVQITIHDARVVQIDRIEKIRVEQPSDDRTSGEVRHDTPSSR